MVRASVTESSSSYITIRQRFPSKYSLQMGRRVLGVEERSSYEEQGVSFRWYARGTLDLTAVYRELRLAILE